jgi:photosystem II stability/assembly factor-like uncharacterized protein
MKKYYLSVTIALLICLSAGKSLAQWTQIYHDDNVQFYDITFPTDNTGYVAATDTGGTMVLCTTNGGTTWTKKYIGGLVFIDKIVMIDSMNGYLIKGGMPVIILKTHDGFSTFSAHFLDTCFAVQAMSLINDSTGFYLNNATRLRKFTHNGTAFSHVIDTLTAGQNMQFTNPDKGYLDAGTALLKTTDTGTTWTYANTSLGFSCVVFRFADWLNGYFSDGSLIYKTNDGGVTFPTTYSFPNTYSFVVKDNFCMAANDTGNVAFTTDGGASWHRETTGINLLAPEPYKVAVSPGLRCFITGQFCGEIMKRVPAVTNTPEVAGSQHISIYPNPAVDQVTLRSDKVLDNAGITVYNYLGQAVKQIKNISVQSFTIHTSPLPAGIYLVRVVQGNDVLLTEKVVIGE